jgi:hypothetical protein
VRIQDAARREKVGTMLGKVPKISDFETSKLRPANQKAD